MSTLTVVRGTLATFAITLDSLASSATVGRSSTAVDNTATNYPEIEIKAKIVLGSTTPANDKAVTIHYADSVDGTNFTEGVTGTDASFTRNDPTNLLQIGLVPTPTASLTYWSKWMVVEAAAKFAVVVFNFSGSALASSGCQIQWRPRTPTWT